jgi:hypothetical protein
MTTDELNKRYDPMNRDELIAECERLRNAITGYVNARLAGLGSTAGYWWELQTIAKEKSQ